MKLIRITDKRVVDALAAKRLGDASSEQWLTDSVTTGFRIRLTKSGKALAYLQYWRGGKGGQPVRMPLGEIGRSEDGKLTVVEARKKASVARGVVDAGGDPAGDQRRERNRLKAETFEDAWKLFTKAWDDEDRYRRETKALVEKDALPALGGLPLVGIKRGDIWPVLDGVSARSKARGYALHAALRACFNWAADKELIEHSPMDRMKSRQAPDAREHFLNEKEIVAFWRASGRMNFPWCYVYRLLLLTGCRREEVAAMEWRELDVEAGAWTIPGEKVKNGKFHIVDLPPLAVEIIRNVRKVTNNNGELQQLLFTSTGSSPPSGFSKAKTALDSLMKDSLAALRPFRIHDLRRTIVSTLTEVFNYDEELGDRILNHKKKGITKIYNLATRRKERKEALLEWSKYVLSLDEHMK